MKMRRLTDGFRILNGISLKLALFLLLSILAAQNRSYCQDNPLPKTGPIMTEELMARLIKYTRDVKETGSLSARICKVLDLCDGTKNMPLRYSISDSTDGKHYFGLRPEADSEDILIVVKHGMTMEAYLTEKSCKLRAAAVLENGKAHLITNEKAVEKFKAELALFAKEASDLPPTVTVPGNK